MKKAMKTTQDVIETTKYLISFSDDKEGVIAGICATHILTPEFVKEFQQYITPEIFTDSYKLSAEMVDMYPSLFRESIFMELMKTKFVEKPSDSQKASGYKFSLPLKMTKVPITPVNRNLILSINTSTNESELVTINNIDRVSFSLLARYISTFRNNSDYELDEEILKSVIREADDEEFNDAGTVCSYLGLYDSVDELLLKRIKDDEVRNTILLSLTVTDSSSLSSKSYQYMSNEVKEEVIGTENVRLRDFMAATAESTDLGWVCKMVDSAVNGDIQFNKTLKVEETDVIKLIASLPEDYVVKLTKLSNIFKNLFSYKIMFWALENKQFSEDQLIEMKDIFKQAGLLITLKKFAVKHGYTDLENALK